jgi:hypothetical protein
VNAKNRQGNTPLNLAMRRGYTEIVELLTKAVKEQTVVHDVTVTNVSATPTCVQGETVSIVVTLNNRGDSPESCTVRLINAGTKCQIASHRADIQSKYWASSEADLIFDSPVSGKQEYGWPPACGDVNGDGYDDLLASANMWNEAQGRAYLYYGGSTMDTTPDKVFTGEGIGDHFGDGSAIGDLNGDNYDDVIVAARGYSGGAEDGRVYIYYGGPNMDTEADLILEGEPGAGGRYGLWMRSGDVNSDGYDDLLITAPRFDSRRGRAYLYYGGNPMDAVCDLIFDGENEGDLFGRSSFLDKGDVNADGYPDILVEAKEYPSGRSRGRVYLYYGGKPMDNTCDKIFTGENDGDEFGEGRAIFDIDNDGFGDVIIGADCYNRHHGQAYLYWGSTDMDVIADKTFRAESISAFGTPSGGHFNNDEYGDILMGAWGYSDLRGRAYIYYGNTRARIDDIPDLTLTNDSRSGFGGTRAIGDVNGDGYDDVIMNGWCYNNGQGRIWLYYGPFTTSADITFNWDTTAATPGKHTLKATIAPVAGEEDVADNSVTVTVEVKEPSR